MNERGKIAYDAFTEHVKARGLDEDQSYPEFEDLSRDIRERWEFVADSVCKRFGAIY